MLFKLSKKILFVLFSNCDFVASQNSLVNFVVYFERNTYMRYEQTNFSKYALCDLASNTACLSGAAKLGQRQRGEKKCGPRKRGQKLEHRAAQLQRSRSAVVFWLTFFFFFYTILIFTERGGNFKLLRQDPASNITEVSR